jgi:hypothetical protein
MSYGARVWDEAGALVMDTSTFTYQILWQGVLDFSSATGRDIVTYTLDIPGFNPANCVFMIIPTRSQDIQQAEQDVAGNQKSYPYVSVSQNRVVVRGANPSANVSDPRQTRIVAKGYAVRFAA